MSLAVFVADHEAQAVIHCPPDRVDVVPAVAFASCACHGCRRIILQGDRLFHPIGVPVNLAKYHSPECLAEHWQPADEPPRAA